MDLPNFPMARANACPIDPPLEYAQIRNEQPVKKVRMWDGRTSWIFTRYHDVRTVLSSPNHFSNMPGRPGYPLLSAAREAQVNSYQTFITMDPPDHTLYRRSLTKEFTQARIEALRPMVQKSVDEILDAMEGQGNSADLVKALALPLPSLVVSLMLGVPYEDHAPLQEWSFQRIDLSVSPEVAKVAHKNMFDYLDRKLREKEANPGDGADMLSRLAIDQILPGKLAHDDAVHMANLIYIAGHETTANQIALGTLSLLQHPEQRKAMEADPKVMKNGVDEMLRFHTIVQYNSARVCIADIEVGGQLIRAGEGVYALLSAADRDPAQFSEPDKFDVLRPNAREHIAFSFGVHQCLGQPLARIELEVVFGSLFKRFPKLMLAVPFEDLAFKRETFVHGLYNMPVSW